MSINRITWLPNPPKNHYKVLVHTITFNQSKYITDTLDGVAMQQTNFPFIHQVIDDASTDGEQDVIKQWMERECDMEHTEYYDHELSTIILVKHKKNPNYTLAAYFLKKNLWKEPQKKQTLVTPWLAVCPYEAFCEGDDYWIDPKKLQKQVDYLDAHEDIVYSCHRYSYKNGVEESVTLQPNLFFDNNEHTDQTEFIFDKEYAFSKEWITKTLTCVFKIKALPLDYANGYKYARDVHMVYTLLSSGKGVCHSFVGGIYRYTQSGIYAGIETFKQYDTNYNVYSEIYHKTSDVLMKNSAERCLTVAMYSGRPLGFPTNLIEFNVYRKILGVNPFRIIKIYCKKYRKSLR